MALAVALAASAAAAHAQTAPTRGAAGRPPTLFPGKEFARRIVAAHRGRMLVVNFWATFCEPCKEELPALGRVARRLAGKDLAVLLVSVDPARLGKTEVPRFLASIQSPLQSYLAEVEDPEDLMNAVDRSWDGTLPFTVIYDRKGALVTRLAGAQTEAAFTAAIRAALRR